MGGMRIEDARELPLHCQEQAAVQILERLAAAAPEIQEKIGQLKLCPGCGQPTLWRDKTTGLEFCLVCGWNRTAGEAEMPGMEADPHPALRATFPQGKALGGEESKGLESCPYCGSESLFSDFDSEGFYIECNGCLARGPAAESRAEAERLWNRRF